MYGLLSVNMINFLLHTIIKAAILFGCFCIITSCENNIQEVRALGNKKTGVEMAYTVESYLSQGGIAKAKLTAPIMERYLMDTAKVIFPKTLHVDFYDATKKIESELFANYGQYLENDNKVLLKDSVIVFNIKGDTLETQELYWNQGQQIFYTDKAVSIRTPDQIIEGVGFRAKQDFKAYTIYSIKPTTVLAVADSTMPK